MAVRIKLEDGTNLLIHRASLRDVTATFQAALEANEPIPINTPEGQLAINPHRVVSFAEEPEPAGNGAPAPAPEPAAASR